jgi:hypothetical protein
MTPEQAHEIISNLDAIRVCAIIVTVITVARFVVWIIIEGNKG